MSRHLTPSSTLDNLKREAKRWLKALQANVPGARARLARALPAAPHVPTLRDVQLALAREHGLSGWGALKEWFGSRRQSALSPDELVNRFLENACPDHHVRGGPAHVRASHTAVRLLDRYPELSHANLATEIVCGEVVAVAQALAEHPELASSTSSAPGPARSGAGGGGRWLQDDLDRDLGAKGWQPLLYLCFTRLPLAATNDNAVAIARMLLERGADPNSFFMAGDSRYTPLVGAIGEGEEERPAHPHRDALVRLLLEHGAEPYDSQVVYNIHFHGPVLWFLELIYERSVQLGRQADWDDPEWRMLDMGGYGSGARWHLDIAISRNDVRLAEWCLAHSANADSAPARDQRLPQHSLYEEAMRQGCTEIAELLVRHGAPRTEVVLDGLELFTTVAFRLDREAAQRQLAEHPEFLSDPRAMFAAAKRDRADVVGFLLDVGVSPDVTNARNERALHMAASAGALGAARLLLDRGAERDPVESNWNNTPLASAVYAQHNAMIELLARQSRDIWELVYSGQLERVRELLADEPALALVASNGHTLLMWLPAQDEALALELVNVLLDHGADPALRNTEGKTAADRAERQGMFTVAALLRKAESPGGSSPRLAHFERMAADLLEAYRTGTPEAMERHWSETWHRRAWPAFRRYTMLDLGRVPAPDDAFIDISLDDARLIVAREQRFGSWQELADFTRALPADKPTALVRPVQLLTATPRDEPRDREVIRDWDILVERLGENGSIGVDAHGQMSDEVLARIARVPGITTLRLGGCKNISDAGARHLAGMAELRHLDLSGTAITDAGLVLLQGLPQLETISLSWTRVTDVGAEQLAGCDSVQQVNLGGTRTGDGAIRALAGKEHLSHLWTGHGVTDAGLRALQGLPRFRSWQGGEEKFDLLSYESAPTHLFLRGPFTDAGMEQLAPLDGLFGLNIDAGELTITGKAIQPLAAMAHLGWLAVDAKDDWMPYIAALPRLRFLGCQDTTAGDDGFEALSRSQSIEGIWGRRCHNLRSRGFRALARMPALRSLSVSCLNVEDSAVATLPDFPSLRELMPMDISDEGYRHIARCERLEKLTLMYCRDTTDRATEHLTAMRNLKRYFASYTQITDRTPELLSGIDSLEAVEFSGCAGLTDAGIAALARLPRLRELKVDGSHGVTRAVVKSFGPEVNVKYSGGLGK